MSQPRTLEQLAINIFESIRPEERLKVWEAAEKYRHLNNVGSYVGAYRTDLTPYMREPMETLQSRDYQGMVFVGPAQSGKTDLFLNYLLYTALIDPADIMLVEKSQRQAADFHHRRVERLHREAPRLKEALREGREGSATFMSKFMSGMIFSLSWPSVNELSGKPIGRIWISDYDRMDDDIGGEGSVYDLAVNRSKTFGRHAMTVAESSPSRDYVNVKWRPRTPHEAPPTAGILALYNRGDRRRFYWLCVSCNGAFEPDFSNLHWQDREDIVETSKTVSMVCPNCGQIYTEAANPRMKVPSKAEMNRLGVWLRDGERWDSDSRAVVGEPMRSKIASFWLKGPAAFRQNWEQLLFKYLTAEEEFETTQQEEALRTTVNTDHALPYLPRNALKGGEILPEDLANRATDLGEKIVPEGCRFLIATVDVQPSRFEVQVTGFGVDHEIFIIDRFKINKSERRDEDGDRKPFNTTSYVEDWKTLIDRVILKTYPLTDGSGEMQIKIVGVDSGGKETTTRTAGEFWRFLRNEDDRGLSRRCFLLKGEHRDSAPLIKLNYPDATRKDRKSGLRGDVPIQFVQTNKAKDIVSSMLGRTERGIGYIHFPNWLDDWFYAEMTAETRTAKGWVNNSKAQNESFDLTCYAVAFSRMREVGFDRIDWDNPPQWAAEWPDNSLISRDGERRFAKKADAKSRLASLAKKLG